MKPESYRFKHSDNLMEFTFVSMGPKGRIVKGIIFQTTKIENLYSLSFGNLMPTGHIDIKATTDNGDRNETISTIVEAINKFSANYPAAIIAFTGSTAARTRLYQIAIGLNYEIWSKKYDIYGQLGEKLQLFQKNRRYSGFVVKRNHY
jgi:hypothetical protein